MVIIGCYWNSSSQNSSLTIESFDETNCVWLNPIIQNSSATASGFSSVTHPTQADKQLITNALDGVVNSLRQAGHTIGAIHEKTWSREPQAQFSPRGRGQKAATRLTRSVKTQIHNYGQTHGIQVSNKEDIPQNLNLARRPRGNFLAASKALVDTYLGDMNRFQRFALCVAMDLANGKAKLTTMSNKIVKHWLIRTTQSPAKRVDIRTRTTQIIQAL